MNGKQYYRQNTNQSIPNEQEQSSYIPSSFFDSIESSSLTNQFTGVSGHKRRGKGAEVRGRPPPPPSISATSGVRFQLK
jgi:hypothetical protein